MNPIRLVALSLLALSLSACSSDPAADRWNRAPIVRNADASIDGRSETVKRGDTLAVPLDSAPSTGYCNTMGTATTMNSLAEALGMQLPGSAAIPAPYRERQQVAYRTGKRAVEMVREKVRRP